MPRRRLPESQRIPKELLEKWLFKYQTKAIDFILSRPYVGLFLDMGLGKTAIILHAFLEMDGPMLLVGPINVIQSVWEREAKEWAATRNIRFSLLRGSPSQRKAAAEVEADIYLVNPELLLEALDLLNGKCRIITFDESTMYKNPSTQRFKSLKSKLKNFDRRIIMTGTPSPNGLMDLWSQIYLLDLGKRLGTAFSGFRDRYFYTSDYMGYVWEPHESSKKNITKKIADLLFRLESKKPRPAPIENRVEIVLPPKARKEYDRMEKQAFLKLKKKGDILTAETAAVKLGKLRQVSAGFVYDEEGDPYLLHDEKMKELDRIVDQTGSPLIIVYQFKFELELLQSRFPQGQKFKPALQSAWDNGEIPILFLHPQSGGHGLNLQKSCHTMAIATGSFSLEQMMQVRGRIDRSGQKHTVVFHTLVALDTVDELLYDVLAGREEGQNDVLRLVKKYAKKRRKDK